MNKLMSFVAVLGLAFTVGCGKTTKSKGINYKEFKGVNPLRTNETVVYETKCAKDNENPEMFVKYTFEITNRGMNQVAFNFQQDAYAFDCNYRSFSTDIRGQGTLMDNNRKMESWIRNISIKPYYDFVTESFNRESLCGHRDWRTFEEKDVTFDNCLDVDTFPNIYLNSSNDDRTITLYICDQFQPVSKKCHKYVATKVL